MRKSYKIPIYGSNLVVAVEDSFKNLDKNFKISKEYSFEYMVDDPDNDWSAITFLHPGTQDICIFIKRGASISDVAHGCVHATNYVYKQCHITPDLDNDEPYAYLLGWFVEQCLDIYSVKN